MSKKEYPHSKLSELNDEELDQLLEEFPFTDLNQQKILNNVRKKQPKKSWRTPRKLALAVAAVFVLLPTSVFAANKLWEVVTNREGFLTTINIVPGEEKEKKYYKLIYNDLPENLSERPQTGKDIYWDAATKSSGFSTVLLRVSDAETFEFPYSTGYVEEEINGHRVWWVEQSGNRSDYYTTAFILFEEEGLAAQISLDKSLSEEAQRQIINGLVLEETTKDQASDVIEPVDRKDADDEIHELGNPVLSKDSDTIKSFGNPFIVEDMHIKDNDVEYLPIEMTISEPRITENLPTSPSENTYNYQVEHLQKLGLLSETGQLQAFEGTIYKRGDGVNNIDEAIETRTVQPYYVEMTFTIENTSSEVMTEFYFAPQLLGLEESVSGYRLRDTDTYMQPLGFTSWEEPAYISGHGEGKAYYNLGEFQPGEVKEVNIGYIVNYSEVPLFLQININGAGGLDLDAPDYQWLKLPEMPK